jgi:hypothetical protein
MFSIPDSNRLITHKNTERFNNLHTSTKWRKRAAHFFTPVPQSYLSSSEIYAVTRHELYHWA